MSIIEKRYVVYAHAPKSRLEDVHHVAHFDRLVEAVETAERWAQEMGDDPSDPSYAMGEKTQVAIYQLVEVIKNEPTHWEKTLKERTRVNE